METIIREGTLRLQSTEASCDVILNCNGQRLTAHKLILSIASPVLRDLLVQKNSEPSLLIFPDVEENTMSLVLEYIYTGSVVLYSDTLTDFLSIAQLLKLELDENSLQKPKPQFTENKRCSEFKGVKKLRTFRVEEETKMLSNRNQRKLPKLLPISKSVERRKQQKILCDYVLQNPWRPRVSSVLKDPKKDYPPFRDQQLSVLENDSNNNFHSSSVGLKIPNFSPTTVPEKCYPLDFHMLSRFPRERNCFSTKINEATEEKHVIIGESKHIEDVRDNSSDSSKSFNSLTSTNVDEESSNSLKITEQDDEEISMGEENEELDDAKKEDRKKINNKLSRSYDREKHRPFTCGDCGKSFSQLRNYKYHRSIHEGTKEFAAKCQECGKVFNDRGYLSSHMKIHRDEKEYACPDCPKRFNQRVAYNMHLRIHTGVKPHECQICGKSFSRKMLLKQHQRVHTGERPYTCPECGKTFADRSNMSLHARLHTGIKPYACHLCTKSFTKKHHLKTHMNFHTGLKPYTCQKCGVSFSQSSNMRTHYKKCVLKESNSLGDINKETTEEKL